MCVYISRLLIQPKEEIIFSKTNSCKNYGFTNCLMLKIVETFQLGPLCIPVTYSEENTFNFSELNTKGEKFI